MELFFPIAMLAVVAGSAYMLRGEWIEWRKARRAMGNVLPPELCSTPEAPRPREAAVRFTSPVRAPSPPTPRKSIDEIGNEIVRAIEARRRAELERFSVALPTALSWEPMPEPPAPPRERTRVARGSVAMITQLPPPPECDDCDTSEDDDVETSVDERACKRMYRAVAR